MTVTPDIINKETLKAYLARIKVTFNYNLYKSIICGLPAVWLYLRSIGQENLHFDILNRTKTDAAWFRELFYLLTFANKHNNFLPRLPENLLKLEIKPEILAAQLPMPAPEFQLAFAFTEAQLKQTLAQVTQIGKLVRVGSKLHAAAIMRNPDGSFAVYHAGNPTSLEFNTLDKCVDLLKRLINADDNATFSVEIVVYPDPTLTKQTSLQPEAEVLANLCKASAKDQLVESLRLNVLSGDLVKLEYLIDKLGTANYQYENNTYKYNLAALTKHDGQPLSEAMLRMLARHGASSSESPPAGTRLD